MSIRDELLKAGVPETSTRSDGLSVDDVLDRIEEARPPRVSVRAEAGTLIFETSVGARRRVEIPATHLWDPSVATPLSLSDLRRELSPLRRSTSADVTDDEIEEARSIGSVVGVTFDDLAELMLLESIRGFGPQKFMELHAVNISPEHVIRSPEALPTRGKRGDELRKHIAEITEEDIELSQRRAARQIVRANKHQARILTYDNPAYPRNLYGSKAAVPILYVRGDPSVIRHDATVACVGSRNIRPPYSELHHQFAHFAATHELTVVSGFALGADTLGHEAALSAGGNTIAVMPGGLDRPFPPENRDLWDRMLSTPGTAVVSEFPFGTAASGLNLRKRNKTIVGLARGVLVSQSSADGGAMNAYRFATEQHKRVATFAPDLEPGTSGNSLIEEHSQERLPTRPTSDAVVFPRTPAHDLWEQWLRELSFSI